MDITSRYQIPKLLSDELVDLVEAFSPMDWLAPMAHVPGDAPTIFLLGGPKRRPKMKWFLRFCAHRMVSFMIYCDLRVSVLFGDKVVFRIRLRKLLKSSFVLEYPPGEVLGAPWAPNRTANAPHSAQAQRARINSCVH